MLLANKIKESEQSIENKSTYFKHFVDSLRQNRPHFPPFPRKNPSINQNDSHLNDHQHPSETNRSEILQLNHIEHELEKSLSHVSSGTSAVRSGEGDRTIRNKLRFQVGNRHRVDRFRLPAYCFEQIKEDLDEHLKEVKGDRGRISANVAQSRHRKVQEQQDFDELMEQKGITGEERPKKMAGMNATIALKYCTINKITSSASLKDILVFFTRMLEVLNYSVAEPKVEKYKNCVYFGQSIRKNQIYEGMVYYYCGIVYYGELYNNQKHGFGVEIDLVRNGIYKGQFRDGQMVGTFQVQKDGQRYIGQLQNGQYHGRGKLIDSQGVFEGQFKAGKKIYGSTQKSVSIAKRKNNSNERRDRHDPSYWSAEKDLNGSRTQYFQFSKNKIHAVNGSLHLQSNMQLNHPQRKRQNNNRYNDQPRDFSYPLNYEMIEQRFNPESETPSAKKSSKVSNLRIREVGKFHNKAPLIQQDEQRPLKSKM